MKETVLQILTALEGVPAASRLQAISDEFAKHYGQNHDNLIRAWIYMLRLAVDGTIAVPDDVLAVLIRWHAEPTRDAGRQRDLISRVAKTYTVSR